MDTKLNPKLLDAVRLPSDRGSLALRTGAVVETFKTPSNSLLIEITDSEGVPTDFIVSEISRITLDWQAPKSGNRAVDTDDAETFFQQGVLLLQNGLIPKAKLAFAQAFRIDPRFAGTLMNLANESANRSAFEAAIFLYEMILELQPSYNLALENLAITHLNQGVEFARRGVIGKAISEFNEVLLLHPMQSTLELCRNNLVAAYTSLGMQLAALKSYPEGMQLFFIALQLNPAEKIARKNLALILVAVAASEYKSTGIPPDEAFKRFIDMGLTLSECLNAFGATLAGLGRISDAKTALRKASEIDPSNDLANQNLDLLESRKRQAEFPLGMTSLESRAAQLAALQ
jgi:tetratricopeptide (TPR) repeat protein